MRALPLLLLPLLPACSDAGIFGTCVDDTACTDGTVCAFGLCVEPNDPRLATVDLEVEPRDAALPVQTVFGIDAADFAGSRVDVALQGSTQLESVVRNDAGSAQPALVQVHPAQSIPGRLRVSSAQTNVDGAFALTVLDDDDVAYRMIITPDSPLYPPLLQDDVVPDDVATVVLDPEGISAFARLHGVVTAGAGVGAQAIEGLEVRVLFEGRRISTLSVTDRDGAFDVALREIPEGAVFEVRPVVENGGFPTVSVPLTAAGGDIDLGVVSLGDITTAVPVEGAVTRSGGAVRGATVAFHGLVGAGSYSGSVVTDDNGGFSLPLIRGNYTIAAVPAAGGRASLVVEELVVDGPIDDLELALPSRVDVDVTVLTQDGLAVASAGVSFERVGDQVGLAEPALAGQQPAFVASADAEGAASVVVDRGRYRVSIQPPRGTGAPAFSTLVTIDGAQRRTFTLPPQNVLAGVVEGAEGAGAAVRVFSRITDENGRAIFLGEAIAEDDGSFAVPVPDLSPQ